MVQETAQRGGLTAAAGRRAVRQIRRDRDGHQSLYQAAKRLRARGVLEPRGRRRSKPQDFVRVAVGVAPPELRNAWRIRLPSGTVFESTTPLSGEQLLTLLEKLAARR